MFTYNVFLSNLRSAVDASGMKHKHVAKSVGMEPQEFSNVLNGRKIVRAEDVPKFCNVLHIEPNYLFSDAVRQ